MPRAGDIVDFHSVIGKPPTHIGYTVTSVGLSGAGVPIAWLKGISGFVSCDALTPREEEDGPCESCFWISSCELPRLEKCRHTHHHFSKRVFDQKKQDVLVNILKNSRF